MSGVWPSYCQEPELLPGARHQLLTECRIQKAAVRGRIPAAVWKIPWSCRERAGPLLLSKDEHPYQLLSRAEPLLLSEDKPHTAAVRSSAHTATVRRWTSFLSEDGPLKVAVRRRTPHSCCSESPPPPQLLSPHKHQAAVTTQIPYSWCQSYTKAAVRSWRQAAVGWTIATVRSRSRTHASVMSWSLKTYTASIRMWTLNRRLTLCKADSNCVRQEYMHLQYTNCACLVERRRNTLICPDLETKSSTVIASIL